jgi:hypothetical protein
MVFVSATVRTAHPKRRAVGWERNGIHQTKLKGPVTAAKERGRWSSNGPAMEQHCSSTASALERAGLVEKVLVFQKLQTKINPIMPCPATQAGLQQTALHDGRSQQRAAVPLAAACGCGYGARSLGFAHLSQFSQ